MAESITLELLHPDARAPERATEDSAGYDLFVHLTHRTVSCSDSSGTWELPTFRDREKNLSYFELPPSATAMIPLGFKAKLPSGCEAQIRPRSGTTFKKGLLIPNSPGTIDADYPEEWMVLVRNPGTKAVRIEHGERIAQMVLSRYEVIPIEMGKVGKTSSRSGGFGSTGFLLLFFLLGCASAPPPSTAVASSPPAPAQPAPPATDYLVFVGSEGVDKVSLIRFGPKGARIERETTTGFMGADVDGPHGVMVAPDGKHWYTTTAHGLPYGYIWKYTTAGDSLVGRVMLGNFPATGQLTPDGGLAFVVNFNLHGEMVPSSVSVVATDDMVEVARITTCTMPHGSRISPDGTKQYSGCMMDDMLVEIDTRALNVSRHFMLKKGSEHGMAGPPRAEEHGAGHAMSAVTCSPTWAQPSADGAKVFVACNKSDEIVEVDVAAWKATRRIPAGPGVYNLAASRDGKLLVGTNKRGQSISIFDVASGRELARLPTKRRVASGVVISPDNAYAFVTVEGVGSEPGTVEIIDLRALATVATVDVGPMAGGIDFWRTEPSR